ncbi:multicopper oxidase domain-containing protein [Blastococcus saxobsidens]|uniref:Copper-containing nitrite reductase n=1 Tax=Blastococcus saxobsidens (strain DD2) TaxID=1146883 RepID=H6RU62_BLASD|nr:multicopper oxidase domain-containing protein [Blastococcus saxobsidens]CCG05669.1 Copper-containing nitrite reductase [Blastococcus saxobsidens DD2]
MTRQASRSRAFWPLRDLPVVVWLVATVVAALVHPFVPAPRWLLIHLVLLGAVSHAILVWSRHFADALLHTAPRDGDRRVQSMRLLLLNGGVLLVLTGVAGGIWPLTVAGAGGVAGAVGWHGAALVGQLRRALPGRFRSTVRYYVAATCFLPTGALLGTLLARGLGDLHERATLAHAVINLLGWMGLTVVGTLVTLWPTMLRTRIADTAERTARRALPVLALAVVVAATGALLGSRPVAAVGLAGYVAGLSMVARVLVVTARSRPPSSYPAWSVAAGLLWLAGCLTAAAVGVGTAGSWAQAGDRFGWLTPFLAAGFGTQVLLGALSYLVPVALGGGAGPVRAANAALDRGGAFRIVVVNAGLLVCALPVPSIVRVACSLLVLAGLATFVPLLFLAIRAARLARRAPAAEPSPAPSPAPGRVPGLAVAGLAAVLLAAAAGVAADPAALGVATAATPGDVAATGRTTTVQVRAEGMRFVPDVIDVPAGDRLVVVLTNAGDQPHDLVLANGARTDRIDPGERAELDAGVIGGDLDGWCSLVGHRQMGMELQVRVVGGSTAGHDPHRAGEDDGPSAALDIDPAAEPDPGFEPFDAALPPASDQRTHRITLPVTDVEREVAPGVTQTLWTFGGTAPGPTLRGRVGDVFEITLVNDGSIGHSIDFHAGALAPDGPMRTIPPGESLTYRFTATRSGIWLYHCATMPMSLHVANGMFGAVVIDPPDLAPVDREYLLVQSEFYLGPQGGVADPERIAAGAPDLVVFNGYARQYDAAPLAARAGERVRIWVLAAGPNRGSSFHVVGGQFDTVYREGAYDLRPGPGGTGGSQALGLTPAQGGFVELTFPEAGTYPFVTHAMADAERGAHGLVRVTP